MFRMRTYNQLNFINYLVIGLPKWYLKDEQRIKIIKGVVLVSDCNEPVALRPGFHI